jgi:hypothetical protein
LYLPNSYSNNAPILAIRARPMVSLPGQRIDTAPDGIQFNREAGVIIESAPIARYFEKEFPADWDNKAKPFVAKGAAPPNPKKKCS